MGCPYTASINLVLQVTIVGEDGTLCYSLNESSEDAFVGQMRQLVDLRNGIIYGLFKGTSLKSEETYDSKTLSSSTVRYLRWSGNFRVSLIVQAFLASGARYLVNDLADW